MHIEKAIYFTRKSIKLKYFVLGKSKNVLLHTNVVTYIA